MNNGNSYRTEENLEYELYSWNGKKDICITPFNGSDVNLSKKDLEEMLRIIEEIEPTPTTETK